MNFITKLLVIVTMVVTMPLGHLFASHADVHVRVPCTYQGQTITTHNITQLAPQAPEALEKTTQAWLAENPQVAATALGYEPFIPAHAEVTLEYGIKAVSTVKTMLPFVTATNEMLKQQGTENVSPFNYVFQHPKDKAWLVKIAGHINRKYNVSHLAQALEMDGSPWGKFRTSIDPSRL